MQNYNLPAVNRGNTSTPVSFILPTNELYDLTGAVARIQVRRHANHELVQEYSSEGENPTLNIEQPHTITLPASLVTLPNGTYKWDLMITFADERVKTYIGGDWVVNAVITE